MSAGVTLVGGGWGGDARVWAPFLQEAAARAGGRPPRVGVVAVRDGDARDHAERLVAALREAGPLEPVVLALAEGGALDPGALDGLDGLLVGGGLTPAYLRAVAPAAAAIRGLVASGVPYAGFSAGSAIAAEAALLGGWLDPAGHPVVDEEVAEGLGPVTVRPGIGLVARSVDVHAAQWGTLARLVAAVDAGTADRGVAVDEDTAVVLRDGGSRVLGRGSAWWVERAEGGVLVRREPAGS